MTPCPKCRTGRLFLERQLGQEVRHVCFVCGFDGGALPSLDTGPASACPVCRKPIAARGIASHLVHAHGDKAMPVPLRPAHNVVLEPRQFRVS